MMGSVIFLIFGSSLNRSRSMGRAKTEKQNIYKVYVIFILRACRFKAKTQSPRMYEL